MSGKTPPDRRGCSADDGFETVEDSPPDTDWEVHINKSAKTSHKPVPGSSLAIRTSRRPSSASILEMRPLRAQSVNVNGIPGYYSILITHVDNRIKTLDDATGQIDQ